MFFCIFSQIFKEHHQEFNKYCIENLLTNSTIKEALDLTQHLWNDQLEFALILLELLEACEINV